jgi:hypothetical protein
VDVFIIHYYHLCMQRMARGGMGRAMALILARVSMVTEKHVGRADGIDARA